MSCLARGLFVVETDSTITRVVNFKEGEAARGVRIEISSNLDSIIPKSLGFTVSFTCGSQRDSNIISEVACISNLSNCLGWVKLAFSATAASILDSRLIRGIWNGNNTSS